MATKITVYLDDAGYRQLRRLSQAQGCAIGTLIREAVTEYIA